MTVREFIFRMTVYCVYWLHQSKLFFNVVTFS